jgi:hypothetical protein
MNIHDLRDAQVHFEGQIEDVLKSRKDLYKLRDNVAKYYSRERINTMPIDHYAIGNELPKKGYNFCYTIERQLDGLGRNFEIIGEAANRIDPDFREKNPEIEWTRIRGFRNRIVHDYFGVDHEIV